MNLRVLHRASACLIAAFAAVHIANHLASLSSVSVHVQFMEVACSIYRQPAVEAVLLLCVTFQCLSGLWFVAAHWKQRHGGVAWLQAASGSYLALFLLIHVRAVMFGRSILGLDTNFYFAAAGFHVWPYQYFFAPYYFLAILALCAHLGCAAYWHLKPQSRRGRMLVVALPMFAGAAASFLIVLFLAGKVQPFEVPVRYTKTYSSKGS